MFLKNGRCLITLIGCSMVNIFIDFLNSILSVELSHRYLLSESLIGFIFAIPFFVYVLGFYFVSKFVVLYDKRVSIMLSFVICSISLFLTGPSQIIEIPEYANIFNLLVNYGYCLLAIPCLVLDACFSLSLRCLRLLIL